MEEEHFILCKQSKCIFIIILIGYNLYCFLKKLRGGGTWTGDERLLPSFSLHVCLRYTLELI